MIEKEECQNVDEYQSVVTLDVEVSNEAMDKSYKQVAPDDKRLTPNKSDSLNGQQRDKHVDNSNDVGALSRRETGTGIRHLSEDLVGIHHDHVDACQFVKHDMAQIYPRCMPKLRIYHRIFQS